jgi:hypothetical protein
VNADNASSNETQMEALALLDNTYDEDNQVRCFNHTLQLSTKTLLKPFNAAFGSKIRDDNEIDDSDLPALPD